MIANWELKCRENLDYQCGRFRAYFVYNGMMCALGGIISLIMALGMSEASYVALGSILLLAGIVQLFFTSYLPLKRYESSVRMKNSGISCFML